MSKLTSSERRHLPESDFVYPHGHQHAGKKAGGAYPIPDASHARNALARVSQYGSAQEKARVRAKVHARYPGMGKK